ncbi:MAG: flagellar hook capping FlgD N-terminal domain-containing protein [Hydrogenovibrio sp.]|nr:flagellar hook capping FlgD N-terminal domain-containing protein [Hydrogenovibrio sp.]
MITSTSNNNAYVDALQKGSNPAANAPQTQLGQTDYLRLLTTQLKNQDPNKPVDPKDFVTNLTQMSQLQSTNSLNTSMESMLAGFQGMQTMQAAGLIGKSVQAVGEDFSHTQGSPSQFKLTPDQNLTDVKVVVSDANGIVKEIPVQDLTGGVNQTVSWDGLDDVGANRSSGVYKLTAYGTDKDGNVQGINTVVGTKVNSVAINKDGTMKLTLATGEEVAMDAVREISQ